MSRPSLEAYSVTTGKTYPSFEDLVAAEGNGWVVVAMLRKSSNGISWPWVCGPYPTKRKGQTAQARLRRHLKRELRDRDDIQLDGVWLRPAWKDTK